MKEMSSDDGGGVWGDGEEDLRQDGEGSLGDEGDSKTRIICSSPESSISPVTKTTNARHYATTSGDLNLTSLLMLILESNDPFGSPKP
ncbi:hypothetical protein MRB53_008651 [Persea americana]|uniref:Uncharacterized protein n=1 Tax=Persea americana TaxID=3435 RepID=A0ACC2MNF6_PERAE|nr:hypothetical protein MRB53_008651 [Persea americana]